MHTLVIECVYIPVGLSTKGGILVILSLSIWVILARKHHAAIELSITILTQTVLP